MNNATFPSAAESEMDLVRSMPPASKPGPMRVVLLAPDQLSMADCRRWEQIRASRPEFRVPFFALRFTECVHKARGDVEVAVVRRGDETIGFLPFHRIGNLAVPVGRFLNDAHNVIAAHPGEIDWAWLLRQCNVKAFDVHALVGHEQEVETQFRLGTINAFSADLGDDSVAYLKRLGKAHKTIGRQPQKTRKLDREVGPVRMEFDCPDFALVEKAIAWKRDQYRRTHILDLFTPDWTIDLIRHLHEQDVDGLRGILSVLWAGDRPVAAHYGMIEGGLLHYWFPSYDPAYSQYSPGTGLFRQIVHDGTINGLDFVDMGYGEQPYKLKQTDVTSSVAFGSLTESRLHLHIRQAEASAISLIKRMPMKEPLKRFWRRINPNHGISKLR